MARNIKVEGRDINGSLCDCQRCIQHSETRAAKRVVEQQKRDNLVDLKTLLSKPDATSEEVLAFIEKVRNSK